MIGKLNVSGRGFRFSMLAVLSFLAPAVLAQQVARIYVPVTYYDFRSDRSNPEFEQPHGGGVRTGAVQNTLDADFKPVAGPSAGANRSMGIAHWFRDWNTYTGGKYGKGSFLEPVYNPPKRPLYQRYADGPSTGGEQWHNEYRMTVTYLRDENPGHDTSFKNIMIRDSLPFMLVANSNGVYEYNNNSFFPLNNRGFGNEWNVERDHNQDARQNFAFSMEMEYPFVVRAGMRFDFRGDDDVWVFIDDRLVLDLGGIKEPANGSFTVDGLGFTAGSRHTLRVFYVERHSAGSSILIQTNIVSPPAGLEISTSDNPNDKNSYLKEDGTFSVWAHPDSQKTIYAHVFDENGSLFNGGKIKCDDITWTITTADGRKITSRGCHVTVGDTIAGNLKIEAKFTDSDDPDRPPTTKDITGNIKPLGAAGIVVMRDSVFNRDSIVTELIFGARDTGGISLWVFLVDRYGNCVVDKDGIPIRPENTTWTPADAAVANITNVTFNGSWVRVFKRPEGEGKETKIFVSGENPDFNNSGAFTKDTEFFRDTINIATKGESAAAIGPNPFVPGHTKIRDALGDRVYDFYKDAINTSAPGGSGILIAVDAPTPLKPGPGRAGSKPGYGRVMIYDGVGNLVHVGTLYQSNGSVRSYAYAWDGTNTKGRRVGPGTYLVRISGVVAETGKAFSVQKKAGVTVAKK